MANQRPPCAPPLFSRAGQSRCDHLGQQQRFTLAARVGTERKVGDTREHVRARTHTFKR